jgi:hypothetical protein
MKRTTVILLAFAALVALIAATTQFGPLQYERTTMQLSPSNALSSNILAGSGITITKGAQGQLTLSGTISTTSFTNFTSPPKTLSYTTTNVFIDFNSGCFFTLTATSTVTKFIGTNFQAGQSVVLIITQDATGQRLAYWNTNDFMFPAGFPLVLSTNANAIDLISMATSTTGTNMLATSALNFLKQ